MPSKLVLMWYDFKKSQNTYCTMNITLDFSLFDPIHQVETSNKAIDGKPMRHNGFNDFCLSRLYIIPFSILKNSNLYIWSIYNFLWSRSCALVIVSNRFNLLHSSNRLYNNNNNNHCKKKPTCFCFIFENTQRHNFNSLFSV